MEISNRQSLLGTVIHADECSQLTSWAFTDRVQQAARTLLRRVDDLT